MKTDIPSYIKGVRKGLGLTQEEFAKALSVSFPTVNRWENDRVKPLPLALKAVRDLEQTGIKKVRDKIEFKEITENKVYNVIFRGRLLYTISREKKYGDIWVVRYATSNRIVDKDQYRNDIFERLEHRIKRRSNQ